MAHDDLTADVLKLAQLNMERIVGVRAAKLPRGPAFIRKWNQFIEAMTSSCAYCGESFTRDRPGQRDAFHTMTPLCPDCFADPARRAATASDTEGNAP